MTMPSSPETGWIAVGQQVGRYKLLQRIGEGGFGTVYMAQQHEPIRRKVALKVIKLGMDTKAVIARFDAERQALAIMDHPHIAKILDGGVTGDGRPYFVMELVSGVPITTYCDDNKLSISDRLGLFVNVCEAVQHAHQKGIIHRDLKPSNVLVTLFDGKPIVKVIDFGVAKAMGRELTEHTMFTAHGEMIGTPQYMSPEQAETSGLDIDTRTDVYSLGVVLYELLTGSTPLEKEALRKAGYVEIQKLVREKEPPRPSQRLSTLGERVTHIAASRRTDPDQLRRDVRGDLDSIILKSLEKERGRRYETAIGLAADVERFLRGDEVLATPPTTGYRLRKLLRRHRSLVAMVAIVAAVLLAATGFSTWQAILAKGERRDALAAKSRANGLRLEAERLANTERAARVATREARDRLKKLLYVADMKVVQQSWSEGNVAQANELLMRHVPQTGEEDFRGFEWYFYLRLINKTRSFPRIALGDDVTSLAAPLLRDLLVVATPTDVRLYSPVPPYQLLNKFEPHKEIVEQLEVAVSPDGSRLVMISGSGLELWNIDDVTEPKHIGSASAASDEFLAVAYSSDGKQFVVGQENAISIWNSDLTKRRNLKLDGVKAGVLAFSGSTIAVADKYKIQVFRDVHRGEDPIVFEGHTAFTTSLSFSHDGKTLASTNHDSTVRLWDIDAGVELETLLGHRGASWSSAFSPSGDVLASIGIDMQVRLWDLETYRQVATYRGHKFDDPGFQVWNAFNLMTYSPDGRTLFTAAADRRIHAWDVTAMETLEVQTLEGHGVWTDSIAFAPDGSTFVSRARTEKDLIFWDAISGAELGPLASRDENGSASRFFARWAAIGDPAECREQRIALEREGRARNSTHPWQFGERFVFPPRVTNSR